MDIDGNPLAVGDLVWWAKSEHEHSDLLLGTVHEIAKMGKGDLTCLICGTKMLVHEDIVLLTSKEGAPERWLKRIPPIELSEESLIEAMQDLPAPLTVI